jgi:hypothetical protein
MKPGSRSRPGTRLAEIPRNMGILEGMVLARAKREGGEAKYQKEVVKQLKMMNAYLFDQTDHATAITVMLMSLRFYVPALSFDEQRALIP